MELDSKLPVTFVPAEFIYLQTPANTFAWCFDN